MVWKPVVGFERYYEVSDEGEVRSLRTGRVMATHPSKKGGHLRLRLTDGQSRRKVFVHTLVLEAFVGPREGRICRHLNGDPADNRLENLAWGTHQENNLDTLSHGTHSNGKSKKTACKRGHLLSGDNLWTDKLGGRHCVSCGRARAYIKYCPSAGSIQEVSDKYYEEVNHGS